MHQLAGDIVAALLLLMGAIGAMGPAWCGCWSLISRIANESFKRRVSERWGKRLRSETIRHKSKQRWRDLRIAPSRVVRISRGVGAIGWGERARRSSLTWPNFIIIFSSLAVVQAGWCKLVPRACVCVDLRKDNIMPS